jgi:hypothetical protein
MENTKYQSSSIQETSPPPEQACTRSLPFSTSCPTPAPQICANYDTFSTTHLNHPPASLTHCSKTLSTTKSGFWPACLPTHLFPLPAAKLSNPSPLLLPLLQTPQDNSTQITLTSSSKPMTIPELPRITLPQQLCLLPSEHDHPQQRRKH